MVRLPTLLLLLTWLTLSVALTGCGESMAYYAFQDAAFEGQPAEGKGDGVTPSPAPFNPASIAMSGNTLSFEGDAAESLIVLDSAAAVRTTFEDGALLITSPRGLDGLVITWDGQPTDIYVRYHQRAGALGADSWSRLRPDTSEADLTHTIQSRTLTGATQLDLYIERPEAVSFLIIEPL